MKKTVIACAVVALLAGAGTATASSLVTSKDIKDGTIANRDLSTSVRSKLDKAGATGPRGATGLAGPRGPQGVTGAQGPAGPAGHDGGLPNGVFVTNKSVGLTASGADFGPYEDGGSAGGSVLYTGLNGKKLSDIKKLVYRASYATTDNTDVGVPYLRVFLKNNAADVIYSPNTQPSKDTAEGDFHNWDVTAGTVRYDDDMGNGPDSAWQDIVAAHGNDVISGIKVSAGFSAGQDLHVLLSDLTVNNTALHFGA
jgi:hypothetical protein